MLDSRAQADWVTLRCTLTGKRRQCTRRGRVQLVPASQRHLQLMNTPISALPLFPDLQISSHLLPFQATVSPSTCTPSPPRPARGVNTKPSTTCRAAHLHRPTTANADNLHDPQFGSGPRTGPLGGSRPGTGPLLDYCSGSTQPRFRSYGVHIVPYSYYSSSSLRLLRLRAHSTRSRAGRIRCPARTTLIAIYIRSFRSRATSAPAPPDPPRTSAHLSSP